MFDNRLSVNPYAASSSASSHGSKIVPSWAKAAWIALAVVGLSSAVPSAVSVAAKDPR